MTLDKKKKIIGIVTCGFLILFLAIILLFKASNPGEMTQVLNLPDLITCLDQEVTYIGENPHRFDASKHEFAYKNIMGNSVTEVNQSSTDAEDVFDAIEDVSNFISIRDCIKDISNNHRDDYEYLIEKTDKTLTFTFEVTSEANSSVSLNYLAVQISSNHYITTYKTLTKLNASTLNSKEFYLTKY